MIRSSLASHQIVTADDVKKENRRLQRKVQKEGGAYFLKSDLEKMNFVVKLEIENAMRKICADD